ncbi:ABC transporter ATP-binding protein [Dokdonella sp.]|uniref:ABC transporter ATP-binding protein n=1 Tax=Dokdonella sp. TaxID=2291710 RepID=UPI001AFD49D7|nr:ABC transporter ATP-binding protein [Dokdonella sp.]MBO9661628.1 ABC transporter ATP-binding protein [Dokdonella sp.]
MSDAVLEISALRAGYGERAVLRDVDLRLARGEWLALLGANGSGKSTLLDVCVGRLAPASGTVRIGGHSILTDAVAAKAKLGYAVAPERLPPLLSARECLAVHAAAKRLATIDADVLELAEALRLAPWLDDAVALMSYGTRQKLGVLLALLGQPELIVLDETFNGLDPASGLLLKRHLRARVDAGRCGVLLATHAIDIAEHWTDRVSLLHEGRLVHEWPREELARLRASRDGGLEAALAERLIAGNLPD